MARVKKRADLNTNRESDKVIVRLPDGMRGFLAKVAERNGRSMNAEVVHALAMYFAMQPIHPEDIETVPDLERGVASLLKEVSKIADAAARITQKK